MLNLVIADEDSRYLDSLSKYIRNKYSSRLNIFTFTNKQSFMEFITDKAQEIDILLVDRDYYSRDIEQPENFVTIVLTDGRHIEKDSNIKYINKYHPADTIYKLFMEIYSDAMPDKSEWTGNNFRGSVITVFSPHGGSGCTTVALSLAHYISKMGMRVFYLNVENISSLGDTQGICENGINFSNIIFYLKERRKNLSLKIEAAKYYDSRWMFYYFQPPDSFLEIDDLEIDDYVKLIQSLKSMDQFDYIVIDMGQAVSAGRRVLFDISDKLVMTICPGAFTSVKLNRLLKELSMNDMEKEILDRVLTVFNKKGILNEEVYVDRRLLNRCVSIPVLNDIEVKQGDGSYFNIQGSICGYIEPIARFIIKGDSDE